MTEALTLKPDAVQWREIEGEIVALDTDAGVYFAGNRSAAVLWPMLARGCTRGELVDRLVEAFAIDRSHAGTDVDEFVDQLRARGLLA
jgi:Coenzyme PQQ synthesis protein D (PqqD)